MQPIHDPYLSPDELAELAPKWHPLDFVALVAGLVPFVLSFSETTTSSMETSASGGLSLATRAVRHIDYVAIAGGSVALACALLGLVLSLRRLAGASGPRALRFAAFALLVCLGIFQLVRGLGVVQRMLG